MKRRVLLRTMPLGSALPALSASQGWREPVAGARAIAGLAPPPARSPTGAQRLATLCRGFLDAELTG